MPKANAEKKLEDMIFREIREPTDNTEVDSRFAKALIQWIGSVNRNLISNFYS